MTTPKKSVATEPAVEPLDLPAAAGLVDPVSPPVEPGPKVETMDDLGITPQTPYPTGNPPQMTHAEINGLVTPTGTVGG